MLAKLLLHDKGGTLREGQLVHQGFSKRQQGSLERGSRYNSATSELCSGDDLDTAQQFTAQRAQNTRKQRVGSTEDTSETWERE